MSKYVELEVLNHRWLKHPHIIKFHELFLTDRHICIVMEYASGGDLFKQVQTAKRLDEPAARWFFQQLIIALDYCHRKGAVKPAVFNRDIKLENILLENVPGSLPLVKICDFGYSKNDVVSQPKSKVGTLVYMAPEVVRGGQYDGEKADLWSCGVMLYVMLVGRYPFNADKNAKPGLHTQSVVKQIMNAEWSIPPEISISSPCRELLTKLLLLNPAERISIASIQQHPWFLANLPQAALEINLQCLAITDYSDVQSEADLKALLQRAREANHRVDDLIDAAIGEEEDDPDPFGLRQR